MIILFQLEILLSSWPIYVFPAHLVKVLVQILTGIMFKTPVWALKFLKWKI